MPVSKSLQAIIDRLTKPQTTRQRTNARRDHDYNLLEPRQLLAGLDTMIGAARPNALTPGLVGILLDNESLSGTRNTDDEIRFDYGLSASDTIIAGDLSGLGFDQVIAVRDSDGGNPGSELQWFGDTDRDVVEEYSFRFGLDTDIALIGDMNGDGIDDAVAVRPSGGFLNWYIHYGTTYPTNGTTVSTDASFTFGLDTDIPVIGDFTGDGKADVAAVRDSNGGAEAGQLDWYIHFGDLGYPTDPGTGAAQSVDATYLGFGTDDDIPVVGDWDNDGDENFGWISEGVGVSSTSRWFVDTDFVARSEFDFDYGLTGDTYFVGVWADSLWTGRGDFIDQWSDEFNWSGDVLPASGSTVVIDQPGSVLTIEHDAGTSIIGTLRSSEQLDVTGGFLRLQGPQRHPSHPGIGYRDPSTPGHPGYQLIQSFGIGNSRSERDQCSGINADFRQWYRSNPGRRWQPVACQRHRHHQWFVNGRRWQSAHA